MSAVTAEEVVVDLLARTEKMERQLANASRTVDQRLSGMEARGAAFASRFTGLLAGVSVAALANEFLKLADVSKTLDAQLKLATTGFGSFTQAQADVRNLASSTRGSLEATAKLYGGFARAAKETGRTQEEAARATQTFAEALKIGGAGTAEAESATLQFNQALQSGTLRGDEFNSIMEASPRIARLLADGLGVPIGQLRAMAEQGKITSDVLFKSLTDTRFTNGIDEEFQALPVTFADAMQQVENAATITFGAFDQGGEFSKALAAFVTNGATGFADLEEAATSFGVEVRAVLDGLGDAFDPLVAGAESAFTAIGGRFYTLREQISSFLHSVDDVTKLATGPGRFAQGIANSVRGAFGYTPFPTPSNADLGGRFDRSSAASVRGAQRRVSDRAADDLIDDFLGEFDAPTRRSTPAASVAKPRKTGRSTAPKSPLDPEAFAREQSQLNDELLRAKQNEAQTAEEVAAFELQRIDAAKARYDVETNGSKRYTEARKAQLIAANGLVVAIDQAAAIRKRDIAIEQRASDAIRRGYETTDAQLRNQIDELQSKGDLARTASQRRDAELRILELVQAQERAEQEHLIVLNQRVLADKNATPDARAEAEAQVARAQARLNTLAVTQPNERQAVVDRNAGPLAQYLREFDDPNTQVEQAVVDKLRAVDQTIADTAADVLGVKDPFLRSLLQIFLQQNVLKPLYEALQGAQGGGGGLGGLLSSVAGLFGGGGGNLSSLLAQGNGITSADAVNILGGRAAGGPVRAGGTYLVGERGPELLRMGAQGGAVVPNHLAFDTSARATPAGGNTIVQQTFVLDARQGIVTPQLLQYVNETARQEATKAGVASYRQSMRDVPARVSKFQRFGS